MGHTLIEHIIVPLYSQGLAWCGIVRKQLMKHILKKFAEHNFFLNLQLFSQDMFGNFFPNLLPLPVYEMYYVYLC